MSFIKETVLSALKVVTSREGIKDFFRISLYRNAIYLQLSSALISATGFFFWLVAARFYSAETIGITSALIMAINLLSLLATLGLDFGIIRFLTQSGEKANEMINSCFTTGAIASIVFSVVFIAGIGIWSPALLFLQKNLVLLISFVLLTTVVTLATFLNQTFIAERKAEFTLARGLIFGIVRFIPLIPLVALLPSFGVFASWGLATSVALAAGVILLLPRVRKGYYPLPAINKRILNEMSRFSLANYATEISRLAPGYILPLVVINLLGAESNAYFYVGWLIGNILFTIPIAISFSLFSEGSYDPANLKRGIKRSMKLLFLLLIPSILVVFLAGDKILILFGGTYSQNAARLVQVFAISALPLGINQIYFGIKRVERKMKRVVGLVAFTGVLSLIGSYFLLPQIGIVGAGIAWLASHSVVAIFVLSDLYRTYVKGS